jgi:ankyrin repeat protein
MANIPPPNGPGGPSQNRTPAGGAPADSLGVLVRTVALKALARIKARFTDLNEAQVNQLIVAVNNGDLQGIETLFAKGAISKEDRGRAVIEAAQHGNLEVVQVLLANGAISKEDRGIAVRNAALGGRLDIIQALLANRATIPQKDRGWAVGLAAQNGHQGVVEELLQNGSISNNDRGDAVIEAARANHHEIIRTLLQNGTIVPYFRGSALIFAAQKGHTQVVQALLANGAIIPPEDRGMAVVAAAENLRVEVVRALLANGPIFETDRDRALDALNAMELVPEDQREMLEEALIQADVIQNRVQNLNPPQADLRVGMDVHEGDRDSRTKHALQLLWRLEDLTDKQIDENFRGFSGYLDHLPKSEKKQNAMKAFSTGIPRSPFPPLIREPFSVNGFLFSGKELIARLWNFIEKHIKDPNDKVIAKEGIISALCESVQDGGLVCNQGKTQRLCVHVLQGRLSGVEIDNLATRPTSDQALVIFFENEHGRRQNLTTLAALEQEAEVFLRENPLVDRDGFMQKLRDYWAASGN